MRLPDNFSFKKLIQGIFFNRQNPLTSWLILTAAAILFGPLLLGYSVGIISAFFLNEPATVIFSIAILGGTMLLPTILYMGVKTNASLGKLSTFWIVFLITITIPASIAYGVYQKAEREKVLRQHIPTECANAEVISFDHFLGDNFDNEAHSSIIFTCNGTGYDFGMKFSRCDDTICGIQRKLLSPANFIEDTFELLEYFF